MLILYHWKDYSRLKANTFVVKYHMTKHQQVFQAMLEENKAVFDEFKILHDKYAEDSETHQKEFNEKGAKIMEIIRVYEGSLVAKSTSSQYAKFSGNLSDKFMTAVRGRFPKIDFIGISIE